MRRGPAHADQTAYAALKRGFENVGDHWEPKNGHGPSDSAAKTPRGQGRSHGGVDVETHSKKELYDRARELDVEGRSSMDKEELAGAIAAQQD